MTRALPILGLTLRGLVDRRRTWLMILLAAAPVLVAVLFVATGTQRLSVNTLDNLVVRTVLPLIALVFGTGAIGPELEDGTIVYLVAKPIRRAWIVLAKMVVAAALTAALLVPAVLATGLVASLVDDRALSLAAAYAVAAAAGGAAYVAAFLAASTVSSRALALGLGYVLIWEGILAGLLEGTRTFSIRQATLGLATGLSGVPPRSGAMDAGLAVAVLLLVIVGSVLVATWRLRRFELRGGD
jgi:ABC-2 type transport system permease protein